MTTADQRTLADLLPRSDDATSTNMWEDHEVALYLILETHCPPPSPDLVESIRHVGVLNPVLLASGDTRYRIIAGRRRVAAARIAGLLSVPARVAAGDHLMLSDVGERTLAIIENEQRSSNPAAELIAIERLIAAGMSEREIASATGMAVQTIRKRLRLTKLVPELRRNLEQGALSHSAATAAARLSRRDQTRLLNGDGHLTVAHINESIRVRAETAVEALPSRLFGAEPDKRPNDPLADIRRVLGDPGAFANPLMTLKRIQGILNGGSGRD